MINTEIIDISKIKKPILVWWEIYNRGLDLEIVYPNSWREQMDDSTFRWEKAKIDQDEFEHGLIAWQYI